MNITIKEIAISSLLILTGGCIIGCVASPATKKKKTASKTNTPKKATVPTPQQSPVKKEMTLVKEVAQEKSDQDKRQHVSTSDVIPFAKEEIITQTHVEDKQLQIESQTKEALQPAISYGNDDFPLTLGSKGKRVIALQKYLLRNHGAQGIVTDQYDQTMDKRVRKYLKVDTIDKALFNKLIYPKKRR